MRRSLLRSSSFLTALAVASCVEAPITRVNFLDPGSESRISITDVPDTVFSLNENFQLGISFSHEVPPAVRPTWVVVEGASTLQNLDGGLFRTSAGIGLLPVTARIEVFVSSREFSPVGRASVVVRQRPASALVRCVEALVCAPIGAIGAERLLAFELRDATGNLINLPTGAFRFGTVVSRAPSVVRIVNRPSPNTITIRAESAGSAWVLLSGEGIGDSVLVEVLP